MIRFSPACPCCRCPPIGVEDRDLVRLMEICCSSGHKLHSHVRYAAKEYHIVPLGENTTFEEIKKCRALFIMRGRQAGEDDESMFSEEEVALGRGGNMILETKVPYPVLKQYLREAVPNYGAKIIVTAEHDQYMKNYKGPNEALSAIGSSMSFRAAHCNGGCNKEYWENTTTFVQRPWMAEINDGIPWAKQLIDNIYHAACCEVVGGTPYASTEAGREVHVLHQQWEDGPDEKCEKSYPFISGERVGRGMVFAVGDSNCYQDWQCDWNNCDFWWRIIEWPVNNL